MDTSHVLRAQEQEPGLGERFARAFSGGIGKAAELGAQHYEAKRAKEEQSRMLTGENEALKRMGLDLSGIQDPALRKLIAGEKLREGKAGAKQGFDTKTLEKHQGYKNALGAVQRMKDLRKEGYLGRGSSIRSIFGGKPAKSRGEYEALGKSLISFSSQVPIRNQMEFQTLAHKLYDPDIPDAEAEGILDAMERIIAGNLPEDESFSENIGVKKNQPREQQLGQQRESGLPNFMKKPEREGSPSFMDFEEKPQERTNLQKAGRVAGQLGLGAIEAATLPYEAALGIATSKAAQTSAMRQDIAENIEMLTTQKMYGNWTEKDEKLLQSLYEQFENPQQLDQYTMPIGLSVQDLAEKVTGIDLSPKGWTEKAARFMGMIKNPSKIAQAGIKNPKALIKAVLPTGMETLRGAGAGAMLQMAEDGEFGPIASIGAMVLGDLTALGVGKASKQALKIAKNPKKYLAEQTAKMASKEAIRDALNQAGNQKKFTKDIGTITGSDAIKTIQSRLEQSGLVGKPLSDLRIQIVNEVVGEYDSLAKVLSEARFQTAHEAGEVAKESMKKIRDVELGKARTLYNAAEAALKPESKVASGRLANSIREIETKLRPGAVKSTEQKAVLDILEKIKEDLYSPEGYLKEANVKDLINNKIALNDIINYEVQGGTKQLLKGVVAELDRAILSHGKTNPKFANLYVSANKAFSEHAKTFRNKSMNNLLREGDPSKILNKMGSVQGINEIKRALENTTEGKQVFKEISRYKLDELIGNNMKDSVSGNLKTGTFAKLLDKKQNRAVAKALLPKESYNRLVKLQEHAGKLAESSQKFFNASKTTSSGVDMLTMGEVLRGVFHLISGNPFPLLKSGSILGGTYGLSSLIADPKFLHMVEDVLKSTDRGIKPMERAACNLVDYIKEVSPAM